MTDGLGNARKVSVPTEVLCRCPICLSAHIRLWLHGHDRLLRLTDQEFAYSKCLRCGVAFQSRRPIQAAIGNFYPKDYAPYDSEHNEKLEPSTTSKLGRTAMRISERIIGVHKFKVAIKRFYACLAKRMKVLDFGCGAGFFLDRARTLGCETIGMDFSPVALGTIERKGHLALSVDDSGWERIADGSIDLIRMNHVLEHLYDPSDVIRRLSRKMAPGGRLHIATPNSEGLAALRFQEYWWGLECPRHIIIFTPSSLSALVGNVGFTEISILHEPLTKDMVRSYVYRQIARGRRHLEDLASCANNGFLNIRFAPACRSAAREGRSDRIHVFAEKPAMPRDY